MKLGHFLSFILVLTTCWMQFYSAVRETFNGISDIQSELVRIKKENEHQQLQFSVEREQFIEFRQTIASLMPDVLKSKGLGEEGYVYRSLASTISKKESDQIKAMLAKTLFERAKENFRNRKYEKSAKLFRQIIDRYGYSTYAAESYFLLAESQYLLSQLEDSTTTIQEMVEIFPQHELTGFALIRLGKIYESQNRSEDAVDIYKTVLRSYPQRDVASQAKASLRGLDL